MDHTCLKCENREYCVTPCKIVNDLLWDDNRVMERHFEDIIVCYPQHREVHFSELKKHVLDKFSEDDVIQWFTRPRQPMVGVGVTLHTQHLILVTVDLAN